MSALYNLVNFLDKLDIKAFKSFVIVGAFVFLLDYSFYQLLRISFDPFSSRVFSYTISTWLAWNLNARYSFSGVRGSFSQYFLGASLAGVQNIFLSIFLMNILRHNYLMDLVSIGLACSYGLFFNFTFQSMITFYKR